MNGTITKRKRSDGRTSWGYVFDARSDEAGKRSQATKSGLPTKREAQDALRIAIGEANAKRNAAAEVNLPTFAAFFERWMTEYVARMCVPKTRNGIGYAIRHTVTVAVGSIALGDMQINAVGPMHLALMTNALLDAGGSTTKDFPDGRPLSAKTVRHIMVVVHGVFERAIKWQLIARNPMDGVDLPKVVRLRAVRCCSDGPI
jgi:integrase